MLLITLQTMEGKLLDVSGEIVREKLLDVREKLLNIRTELDLIHQIVINPALVTNWSQMLLLPRTSTADIPCK